MNKFLSYIWCKLPYCSRYPDYSKDPSRMNHCFTNYGHWDFDDVWSYNINEGEF